MEDSYSDSDLIDEDTYGEILFPIKYGFEIHFLVAKEKAGHEYPERQRAKGQTGPQQRLCPVDEEDPTLWCLERCARLLARNGQPVSFYKKANSDDPPERKVYHARRAGPSPRFGTWNVSASLVAKAVEQSPNEYDWIAITLRSPLLPEHELRDKKSKIKWLLSMLRAGLVVHVNSTCRLSVFLQSQLVPLSGYSIQKLLTMVWLTEKDMLRRICPPNSVPLITTHSKVALEALDRKEQLEADEDEALKLCHKSLDIEIHDPISRYCLSRIWDASTLRELRELIEAPDGTLLAFTVNTFNNEYPVVAFHYGLWHPHRLLDMTRHWVLLCINYLFTTQLPHPSWTLLVTSLDVYSRRERTDTRYRHLLRAIGVPNWAMSQWERIYDAYKEGAELGPGRIDGYRVVEAILGLKKPV